MVSVYHKQTKNLLVSYSPKKLGFTRPAVAARPQA